MITPADVTVLAYRNGDYRDQFTVTLDGVAINLTGYSIKMQVRDSAALAANTYVTVQTGSANASGGIITLVTPASGIFEVFIDQLDWADVPEGVVAGADVALVYDILFTKPSAGDVYPYIGGAFVLKHGVTLP